jgi:BON domain-containing protein
MNGRRAIAAMVFATLGALPAFAGYDTVPANAAESIIVTEPRAAQDELITRDVVEVLSNDSRLAGRIGVQTTDREVELTGIVTNASLSLQAERDAKSVYGVRAVHNKLATRMGGGRY